MPSLMIMVPVRGRRESCERLLKAFADTLTIADACFITDPDDAATYDGIDWGKAQRLVLDPRGMIGPKRNYAARMFMDSYDAVMCAEDDIVPGPHGWDATLMGELAGMGGTGMVYPDDDRRTDVPENVLISTDIVRALGWFCEPSMQHYYIDDVWGALGRQAGCLKLCKDVLFENFHYTMAKDGAAGTDAVYSESERLNGTADAQAYQVWRRDRMAADVATVRKVLDSKRTLTFR